MEKHDCFFSMWLHIALCENDVHGPVLRSQRGHFREDFFGWAHARMACCFACGNSGSCGFARLSRCPLAYLFTHVKSDGGAMTHDLGNSRRSLEASSSKACLLQVQPRATTAHLLYLSLPPSLLPSFPPCLLASFPPSLLLSFSPSLLPSLTPSLTDSLTHSLPRSLAHSLTHSLMRLLTRSFQSKLAWPKHKSFLFHQPRNTYLIPAMPGASARPKNSQRTLLPAGVSQ